MTQSRYFHQDPQGLPKIVKDNRFAVIDVETTGLSRNNDQVIQLAVAQVDFGRPRFRGYVHIRPSRTIHPDALKVHGIGFDVLQHAFTFGELAGSILELIGDRVILGYGSSSLDIPMLKRQFAEESTFKFDPPSLDVLTWARRILPKEEKKSLKAVAAFLQVPVLDAHDAFDDCRMTWNVFVTLAAAHAELGVAPLDTILSTRPQPELKGVLL